MAKKKALVIDYEPRGLEQIGEPLRRAGFDVVTAANGVDGLAAFERYKPHVTLLEAMLPKRHGFEVAQEMKSTPHGARSAVIIVTAVYKGRKYRTQALHHYGCDAFLEKPVDPEKLLEVVRQFVGDDPETDDTDETGGGPGSEGEPAETTEAEIVDHLDRLMGDDTDPGSRTPSASVVAFETGRTRRRPAGPRPLLPHAIAVGGGTVPPAPVAPVSTPRPVPVITPPDAVPGTSPARMGFLLAVLVVCAIVLVLRMI